MNSLPLLAMHHIDKRFFGKSANTDISFEVERGEIHALLGENGAGKTTLMNILYGIYSRDGGTIRWKGEEITFNAPSDAIAAKIGMVHQHFMLVPTLTVAENIILGLKPAGHPFPDMRRINAQIRDLCDIYGLDVDPTALVADLSVGERQRIEIIKLLYRDAELLILDEPTAVLTPQETERLFQVLRRLRDEGHAVILITHRIPEVMTITDRITILRHGESLGTFVTADMRANDLSNLMIGHRLDPLDREGPASIPSMTRQEVLSLKKVTYTHDGVDRLRGCSLTLHAGEILGIAGVDGNGQKEIAEIILGLIRPTAGVIEMDGEDLSHIPVQGRRVSGIAYIPDDRHRDALILEMDLCENVLLTSPQRKGNPFIRWGLITRRLLREKTLGLIDQAQVKTPGIERPVRLLSGGNQQRLILARELDRSPRVIVAFQPTRGLDIGASHAVRERLLQQRSTGAAILLISADLEEVTALSDRISVLYHGSIAGTLSAEDGFPLQEIGRMMSGGGSVVQEVSI